MVGYMQLAVSTSGRSSSKWKIITIIYVTSLLLYIVACFRFGSTQTHLDVCTLLFSIVAVFIALFWSLDEARKGTNEQIAYLHQSTTEQIEAMHKLTLEEINTIKDSTRLQIESFSTQSQGIVSALEKVTAGIGQMSEYTRKQMEQEEKRLEVIQKQNEARLRAQEREAQKDWEQKQRIAPRIFARIASEPFLFFFRHYRLHIYNTGGPAKNIELTYFFSNSYNTVEKTVPIGSLNRDRGSTPIDCGDVQALSAYPAIQVSVSLRDKEERLYVGTITIDKSNSEWVQISVEERPGE